MSGSAHLLHGADPSLLADAVRALVQRLVGDGDRSLLVEELVGDEYDAAAVVDAAQTPPFLTDKRVVVARGFERFSADELAPVIRYLAAPLDTTELILEWAGSRVPKKLTDAVTASGGSVVDASAPSGKGRRDWLSRQVKAADLDLDAEAKQLVGERLGDDLGRLSGVLEALASAYGPGAELTSDDVEPFLGEAGSVPPWDLTDAIDAGDTAVALDKLHRMLGAGERHWLQVMGTLISHYGRMLRLDGAAVADERAAAEVLGMKGSTYPARKALSQARRLEHTGVARAIELLADADLDLRGVRAWPEELVLEVLVARLSRLGPRARAGRR